MVARGHVEKDWMALTVVDIESEQRQDFGLETIRLLSNLHDFVTSCGSVYCRLLSYPKGKISRALASTVPGKYHPPSALKP